MRYEVEIKLTPKAKSVETIVVDVDKQIDCTCYDDVIFKAYDAMDKDYPQESCPNAAISKIWVCDEGEKFPVVSESDKEGIENLKKDGKYKKFLVLPEARYYLTKEAKLWMKLKEHGLISEDEPFDIDKMHELLEDFK